MKKTLITLLALFIPGMIFAQSSTVAKDYFKMDEIKTIRAELSYESIIIEKIYGDEVTIEISTNNNRKIPEYDVNDGELLIHNVRRYALGDRCNVYLYIPQDLICESVSLTTASGDISVKEINTNTFSANSASGDIRCEQIISDDSFFARALSGDIDLRKITSAKIETKASSGDLDMVTLTADEVIANTASGDIGISLAGTEYLSCHSSSGTIECRKITCDYFDLKAASGSIALKLLKQPEAESSIVTASGSIRLAVPRNAAFEVNVRSTSGIFEDDLNGVNVQPRRNYISKYNGGGALINLETRSGSINLDD